MLYTNSMKIFAGILCLSWLSAEQASAQTLSGAEIKSLISGRTVKLSTPFGVALPLFYAKDGVVSGDISGITAASLFAPKEKGKWWITGNSMCQQWPSWYDGRRFCFEITSINSEKIKWSRDDGATGTAVVVR